MQNSRLQRVEGNSRELIMIRKWSTHAIFWDEVIGHGSCGSRVSCLMGHVSHGSQNMTHCQLCRDQRSRS